MMWTVVLIYPIFYSLFRISYRKKENVSMQLKISLYVHKAGLIVLDEPFNSLHTNNN